MGTVAAALSSRADAERMPNRRNGEGVICVLGRTYVCVDDQAARVLPEEMNTRAHVS